MTRPYDVADVDATVEYYTEPEWLGPVEARDELIGVPDGIGVRVTADGEEIARFDLNLSDLVKWYAAVERGHWGPISFAEGYGEVTCDPDAEQVRCDLSSRSRGAGSAGAGSVFRHRPTLVGSREEVLEFLRPLVQTTLETLREHGVSLDELRQDVLLDEGETPYDEAFWNRLTG